MVLCVGSCRERLRLSEMLQEGVKGKSCWRELGVQTFLPPVVNGGQMMENSRASTCALLYSVLLVSVCNLNTYGISQRGLPEQNRVSA